MTTSIVQSPKPPLSITWEKLPPDFELPDEPVESNLQPLLAAALRESLELAGLIIESVLIATNFGICATVNGQTTVKAPDWVYIPSTVPFPDGETRRSYTPCSEGDKPTVVMEFISATDGGERLDLEHQLLVEERQRAEQAEAKSDRLAEKLKAMGINPEEI